jgi:hypothetical protein
MAVRNSLIDLGHSCTIAPNAYQAGATNILLGSTIFASRHLQLTERLRGKPYIVYQVEQLDDARGLLNEWPEYWELLANATEIWDYGPSSTQYLRDWGFPRVAYLPPGFHPCIESFRPSPEPDFEVAFCGASHPRRKVTLDALAAKGLKIAFIYGVYGAERNAILARSKIILNVHAWDDLNALETVRLSLMLANHCFVISEVGDHNPYGAGLVYAGYDALVEACLDYARRPRQIRDSIAARGHAALRSMAMVELMRTLLP